MVEVSVIPLETVYFINLVDVSLVGKNSLLTVRALLGSGPQQKLSHGHIVGHDGDIERQETFTVWSVEVQLLQAVLGQKKLDQVQFLVLHCLKQSFIALELRHREDLHFETFHPTLYNRLSPCAILPSLQ